MRRTDHSHPLFSFFLQAKKGEDHFDYDNLSSRFADTLTHSLLATCETRLCARATTGGASIVISFSRAPSTARHFQGRSLNAAGLRTAATSSRSHKTFASRARRSSRLSSRASVGWQAHLPARRAARRDARVSPCPPRPLPLAGDAQHARPILGSSSPQAAPKSKSSKNMVKVRRARRGPPRGLRGASARPLLACAAPPPVSLLPVTILTTLPCAGHVRPRFPRAPGHRSHWLPQGRCHGDGQEPRRWLVQGTRARETCA